jgi:hypothetical protein
MNKGIASPLSPFCFDKPFHYGNLNVHLKDQFFLANS